MCSRLLSAAVVCAATFTAFHVAADRIGAPLPWLSADLQADNEAGRVADFQADTARRLAVGERVATDVAAGRLGLWEAAGVLAEVNGETPVILVGPECLHRDGRIGTDVYARHLIEMVSNRVKDPARRAEVVRRLEAELVGSPVPTPRPR